MADPKQLGKVTKLLLVCALAGGSVGCATIYKSTAGDYVDAAKPLLASLQNAETALATADASWKASLIAKDAMCPIQADNVYLRPVAVGAVTISSDYFTELAGATGDSRIVAACQSIGECPEAGHCGAVCYNTQQTYCIDLLKQFYARSAAAAGAPAQVKKANEELTDNLSILGYNFPRAQNYLAQESVQILSQYLDVLSSAADGQAADVKQKAADLGDTISSAAANYKSLTGRDLISATELSTGKTKLTALGAFAQDIATIVQTEKDDQSIRRAVVKSSANAQSAMDDLQKNIEGDIELSGAIQHNIALDRKASLMKKFKMASLDGRQQILRELASIQTGDTTAAIASLNDAFSKARDAHKTLIMLIENPSDKQLQQIRAEEFASFRSVAEDLASLITALK